ncbi:hypothetical protein [Methylobacterium sp. JK268]
MTETRKPINPLEREEAVGIRDGSDHRGEPATPGRHGTGVAPAPTAPPPAGGTGSAPIRRDRG